MIKKPAEIIQEQINPSQSRGGFGGLLDYARKRDENTGLSRAQTFAAALDPLIMPEMRAGEGIRERGMQRVAAGNKNKTIQMLIDRNRQDLADMVRNGSLDIKTAMSILLTPQKQQAGIAVGNNIINPVTGEVIYEGTGGGDVDVTERSALRKEFTGLQKIKDFSKVSDAYTRVVESSRDPSAAGDLALIFNYMKVLDPGPEPRRSPVQRMDYSNNRRKCAIPPARPGQLPAHRGHCNYCPPAPRSTRCLYSGRQSAIQFRHRSWICYACAVSRG